MEQTTFFKIREKKFEMPDTVSYVLEPVLPATFRYQAGQFLTFVFRHTNGDLRRSYSLFTTPEKDEFPAVLVKRIANGEVSRYLHDNWKVGDMVEALPPSGRFLLSENREKKPRDIFLFAAGSGISPLFGLMNQALLLEQQSCVHLFYSNHSKTDTIFFDELEKLRQSNKSRLYVEYFFSDAKRLERARLSRTLIEHLVPQHLNFAKEEAVFFLCGPYHYMQMIEIVLVTMGISKQAIRKEIFIIEKPAAPRFDLEDKSPRKVTLDFGSKQFELTVQFPDSILDAALKKGISVPFSCRAGRCSTCFAKCVEGKVEMSYNEVLTEKDEEQGYVLTCTGHPVSESVKLKF